MRLIDAEDLKARAREEIGGLEVPFASHFAILVEWLVDKTSTAYDIEKVVKQIQKKHCVRCRNILSVLGAEVYCKENKCQIEELCEIVRKGGVE